MNTNYIVGELSELISYLGMNNMRRCRLVWLSKSDKKNLFFFCFVVFYIFLPEHISCGYSLGIPQSGALISTHITFFFFFFLKNK